MPRAVLMVMDSVGCGGAPDAAAFGDEGANTLGHIALACAEGRAESGRSGPLHVPTMAALGLGSAIRAASGLDAGLPGDGRHLGRGHRGLPRQGHALRPLGARRRAGALGVDLFPAHRPGDPAGDHPAPDRARRPPRHALQRACLRHAGDPRLRPRAYRQRQADPLHLRRQRAADRRARDPFRPRPALRGLPHRRRDRAPAARRPGDRPALRRRDGRELHPHPEPQGPRDPAAGAHPPRPGGRRRRSHPRHRQDRRHLRPPRHLDAGQGQGRHGAPRRDARRARRGGGGGSRSSPTTSISTRSGATPATSPATPARSKPSTPGCPRFSRASARAIS